MCLEEWPKWPKSIAFHRRALTMAIKYVDGAPTEKKYWFAEKVSTYIKAPRRPHLLSAHSVTKRDLHHRKSIITKSTLYKSKACSLLNCNFSRVNYFEALLSSIFLKKLYWNFVGNIWNVHSKLGWVGLPVFSLTIITWLTAHLESIFFSL